MKNNTPVTYTVDQILSHVDSLIDRQRQDLEELISMKPRPVPALQKSRARIGQLEWFRRSLASGQSVDQRMLLTIAKDMHDLGW